jgi:hypothetical protein
MPDENSFSFSIFSYPDAILRGAAERKTFFNVTTFREKFFSLLSVETTTFVYAEDFYASLFSGEILDKISKEFSADGDFKRFRKVGEEEEKKQL